MTDGRCAAAYATLRNQPFHRDRPERAVLARFFGTTSGRKLKYAGLLTSALAPDEVPSPLVQVISAAARSGSRRARWCR